MRTFRGSPWPTDAARPGRRSSRFTNRVGLIVLVGGLRAVSAQELPRATLDVTRTSDAADCPVAEAIAGAVVAQGLDRDDTAELTAVSVHFDRVGERYSARILLGGPRGGVRHLEAAGPTCEALAAAVTVSLALLLDAHARGEPLHLEPVHPEPTSGEAPTRGEPSPEPSAPELRPVTAERTTAPAASPAPRRTARGRALGGVALGAGLPRELAPVARLGLGLEAGSWSVAARAFGTQKSTLSLGPGQVDVTLRGAVVQGCVAAQSARSKLRADACALGAAGRLAGRGRQFAANEESAVTWLAVGAGGGLGWEVNPRVTWAGVAEGYLALHPHDFRVEGLGVAFHSRPLAGVLGTELRVRIW